MEQLKFLKAIAVDQAYIDKVNAVRVIPEEVKDGEVVSAEKLVKLTPKTLIGSMTFDADKDDFSIEVTPTVLSNIGDWLELICTRVEKAHPIIVKVLFKIRYEV